MSRLDTMIRRVSSRQRIVSWDAFDATAYASGAMADEEFQTCLSRVSSIESLTTCGHPLHETASTPVLGKRIRRISLDLHQDPPDRNVQDLPSDVQICIVSFLTVDDARRFSCTGRYMHKLIQNQSFLWKQWCFQQWPNLPTDAVFVDESSISVSAMGHSNYYSSRNLLHKSLLRVTSMKPAEPNFSKLLQQRAIDYPTVVDMDGLLPYSTYRFRNSRRSSVFCTLAPTKIQFTGTVGTGDRCVRANEPLPRPVRLSKSHFLKFLCRGESRYKPFCSPFLDKSGNINLTPRLLAYFEVAISAHPTPTPLHRAQRNDCVAIGLSRQAFSPDGRMPGWDSLSYGYHGDDGGLFHNGGDMIRRFGPSFGAGDIVGCGVDYVHGGVFFTLNGEFLGYGWTQLDLDDAFYPTIGVDTNSVLEANFGASAFSFDMANFCREQQRQQIQETSK